MASTTLCDYQVLMDGAVTLDAAGTKREHTLHFEVPSDFEFGTGPRRPILAFKAAPISDARFRFLLNNREIAAFNLDASHTRGLWEAFAASDAFPEGASFSNPAPLRIIVSEGQVRLEDVVIWYQIKRDG